MRRSAGCGPRIPLLLVSAWIFLCLVRVPAGGAAAPLEGDCQRVRDGSNPRLWSYRVVKEIPSDPEAFTQGFLVHRDRFYLGTGGCRSSSEITGKQSAIMKLDMDTGDVLERAELDTRYFGEGIAVFRDRLYQLTWKNRLALVYSPDRLDPGSPVRIFRYPSEGWGLTHDGTHLIMSDGTATLRFLDPDDFHVVRSVQVHDRNQAVARINELEFINGEIFANIYMSPRVARICPETGIVNGWIDFSGLHLPSPDLGGQDVLNGIAFDPDRNRLFVTGKLWGRIYEVSLVETDVAGQARPERPVE